MTGVPLSRIHTCHADCPCQHGQAPVPDFEEATMPADHGDTAPSVRMYAFIEESNRIEGIHRVADYEIAAHAVLLSLPTLTVEALEGFVADIAAVPLRGALGQDVRVGNYVPPPGGPGVRRALEGLVEVINDGGVTPYEAHVEYEKLHPFMDGNGRSGRAVWAWHMRRDGLDPFVLPFLHRWYYQSLDGSRA